MRLIFTKLACLITALISIAAAAQAEVTSVTGTPSVIRVNPDSITTVRVGWSVSVRTRVPATVSSPVGQVIRDAAIVASPGGVLSQQVATVGVTTVQFAETISIGRTAARALLNGATVVYRGHENRRFRLSQRRTAV